MSRGRGGDGGVSAWGGSLPEGERSVHLVLAYNTKSVSTFFKRQNVYLHECRPREEKRGLRVVFCLFVDIQCQSD